jgi:hypothetical protein
MRTSVHTAIVLAILAMLAVASVSLRVARTEHEPLDKPRAAQHPTSDPDDIPPLGGLQ